MAKMVLISTKCRAGHKWLEVLEKGPDRTGRIVTKAQNNRCIKISIKISGFKRLSIQES